jgi:type IV pilus assembly protein PilC
MPQFKFKSVNAQGQLVEDTKTAKTREELAQILKSDGYKVLSIKPVEKKGEIKLFAKKIPLAEKANFFKFMATMLKAGLSVSEGVEVVKEETQSEELKKVLTDISYQTSRGSSLASVLATYKKDFDPVVMAIVKVGEESGTLDKSFEYLGVQLSADYEMTQKIRGAFAYPAVIMSAMGAVGLYMIVGVLPKVSGAFMKLNIQMPFATLMIMKLGVFVGENTIVVIGAIVGLAVLLVLTIMLPPVRKQILSLFAKLKPVKKVLDQIDIARYARTLSTLTRRGVSIVEALEISADTITQPKLHTAAKKFSGEVTKGKLLSQALLEEKKTFPPVLVQTVRAGEKTGMLDKVLEEMAEFYEAEVERSIKKLTDLLEPVLILVIGVLVGGMVVMLIAPIYNVVGSLQSAATN